MKWAEEDQPFPLKVQGLPWDDPNSDPVADLRRFANVARLVSISLVHESLCGGEITSAEVIE